MARIRTVKPEMFSDEKLAALTPTDRLTFVGLISYADDAGRLVDNVKTIDGLIFPLTDDSSRDSLDTLARVGLIIRYHASSGQRLIQITNWARHQKVDKPSQYVLPAPDAKEIVSAGAATIPGTLASGSRGSRESVEESSVSDLGPWTLDRGPTTKDPLPAADVPSRRQTEYSPEFEHAWSLYPERAGGNPKRIAHRAWKARCAEGTTPDELTAAVERYAAYVRAEGKEGSAFVLQAVTFFGPGERWCDAYAVAGQTKALERAKTLVDLLRQYNLYQYDGNQAEYAEKVARAAEDPRAGPRFQEEVRAIRPNALGRISVAHGPKLLHDAIIEGLAKLDEPERRYA